MTIPSEYVLNQPKANKPATVDEHALKRLLEGIDNNRDCALISLMATSGLRLGEISKLDTDSISIRTHATADGKLITYGAGAIPGGASLRERRFYCDRNAVGAIQAYLQERNDGLSALFISRLGQRLSRDHIGSILTAWCRKLGIPRIRAHELRRRLGLSLSQANASPSTAATVLGLHAGSATERIAPSIEATEAEVYLRAMEIAESSLSWPANRSAHTARVQFGLWRTRHGNTSTRASRALTYTDTEEKDGQQYRCFSLTSQTDKK